MIKIQRITQQDPLYQQERELRNVVLLRPIGLPDNGWEMNDHKAWHFVAVENNTVVGCVVLVPSDTNKPTAQLVQMAIATTHQGKGIGKLLVVELLAFAKQKELLEITCHSRENAIVFYKKLGFEVYGTNFEEVGIPHSHMRIRLK